jgi:hypothetical protein
MSSSCNIKCTSSTCYCYTGLNLPCINVLTNESLTDIVQKIEYELCLLLGQITTTTTSSSSSTTTTTTTLVNEPLCAIIQAEIGNVYRNITSTEIINGKFAYSVEGFEIFWNPTLSRWESWLDGDLSSYLENSENYPIGTWTPVIPVPYISVITLGECPA